MLGPSASTARMIVLLALSPALAQPAFPFNDESLPRAARAADLVSRLTLEEKVGMLTMDASMAFGNDTLPVNGDLPSTAVPRLGVPQFNWMSGGNVYRGAPNGCDLNCCTACPSGAGGCCTDGFATQLPQGTGIAAAFNVDLAFALGRTAGRESRGIQNGRNPRLVDYRTAASSVINILRDGRWGRAPETYGECPFLTAETAIAFNQGVMGFVSRGAPPPDYVMVVPTLRHFVAYAGPDSGRFNFDALVSEDDLRLTYLPAWRRLASTGAMGGVMSAISSLNSIPSAAHTSLLSGILRGEWNASSFVISDCDTIGAISTNFHYTASVEQAAVAALRSGGDINCGGEYALLLNATKDGWLMENEITPALLRVMEARVRAGALNTNQTDPYSNIPYAEVDSQPNRDLARRAVRESVVLLFNDGGALPLGGADAPPLLNLLVVGPSADDPSVQAHTYHGTPWRWTTVLTGLREALNGTGVNVSYVRGCSRTDPSRDGFSAAVAAAGRADAIVFVGGLEAGLEEEDTDRADFTLPGAQLALVQALAGAAAAQGRAVPVAVVIVSGGPVSEPWLASRAAPNLAWLWVSYFGQDGGGVADVLLGTESPSGRLPFTMPVDTSQIGPITDYSMRGPPFGRTYRYLAQSTSDGFTELDSVEITGTVVTGGPGCDGAAVPGQCSFARGASRSLCAAWADCAGVTCNSGRGDCQARGAPLVRQAAPFTSFIKGGAAPLFPFGHGLSFANITTAALSLAAPAASLGDAIALNATVLSEGGPEAGADFAVLVFGAFEQCDGSPSPVPALPVRSLLAFTKVRVPRGARVDVPLTFFLDGLHVPGAERQAFPGRLRLWAGDGGGCEGCAGATLELLKGGAGCAGGRREL
jgi:beta-glucosidase-like glycosyl hydrolase